MKLEILKNSFLLLTQTILSGSINPSVSAKIMFIESISNDANRFPRIQ